MPRFALFFAVFYFVSTPSHAAQSIESLELKVLQSDCVLLATVESTGEFTEENKPAMEHFTPAMAWVTLNVLETLSGDSPKGRLNIIYLDYNGRKAETVFTQKTPQLFFLKYGVRHKWLSMMPQHHQTLSITYVDNEVLDPAASRSTVRADETIPEDQEALLKTIRSVRQEDYVASDLASSLKYFDADTLTLKDNTKEALGLPKDDAVTMMVPWKK